VQAETIMDNISNVHRKNSNKKEGPGMNNLLIVVYILLCSFTSNVYANSCPAMITYEGGGAGKVIFDGTLHSSKDLTCANCHEGQGFMPALFEMKKGATVVNMHKMEMGRTCGRCHIIPENNYLICDKCHHK
jgi:c(7)-type cytochrome triheme protein